ARRQALRAEIALSARYPFTGRGDSRVGGEPKRGGGTIPATVGGTGLRSPSSGTGRDDSYFLGKGMTRISVTVALAPSPVVMIWVKTPPKKPFSFLSATSLTCLAKAALPPSSSPSASNVFLSLLRLAFMNLHLASTVRTIFSGGPPPPPLLTVI